MKRIVGVLLALALLAIPTVMPYAPAASNAAATLDTYGQNVWAGIACGVGVGAVVVAGGMLAAGTIGLGLAFAFSAGLHVAAVCAVI